MPLALQDRPAEKAHYAGQKNKARNHQRWEMRNKTGIKIVHKNRDKQTHGDKTAQKADDPEKADRLIESIKAEDRHQHLKTI